MSKDELISRLSKALVNILDGNDAEDIIALTGMSEGQADDVCLLSCTILDNSDTAGELNLTALYASLGVIES